MKINTIEIPLWDDKWGKDALEKHLERVGITAFNRGLRNIALSNKDRTFPSFEKCLHYDAKLAEYITKDMVIYSGVDLSTKKRPGTCIFTLGLDRKKKIYYPIDIRYGKWTGPKLLEQIYIVQDMLHPKSFLVENNALQDMVIDLLKEDIKKKNIISTPFIKGYYTGTGKLDLDTGLSSLELDFSNDKWFICMGDKEHSISCKCGLCKWKDEVMGHPFYETTDILMASWIARENARKSIVGKIRIL
jgi:hypothetical protein